MHGVELLHESRERITDMLPRGALQGLLRQPTFFFYFSLHAVDHGDDLLHRDLISLRLRDQTEHEAGLGVDRNEIVVFTEFLGLVFRHGQAVTSGEELLLDELADFVGLLVLGFGLVYPIYFCEGIGQILRHRRIGVGRFDGQDI